MKMFLLILLIFLFISNCYSQSGWIKQNSGINSNVYSVKFVNIYTGWCVGDSGIILKTANGGTNWIQQSSGFINNLRSVFFTSIVTGYCVGDSGLALKTTDGGISWNRLSLIKPFYLFTSVFFVNDSLGFIGGIDIHFNFPNKIFKTINRGNSWDSVQTEQFGVENYINSIFFINSNTGWIIKGIPVLSSEGVYKTTNGGVNWFYQFNGTPPFNAVYFIDSLNGWLSGISSFSIPTIFRTTNGGNNWSTNFPGTGYLINSLYFTSRNKGWAVGENSIIQATTNGGNNWTNQTISQTGINYHSIYLTDSLIGWVVGDSGTILKTTTGGTVGFNSINSIIPDNFYLHQNYPNPFNPSTVISYQLPVISFVIMKVYDILGNEVATLVNEKQSAIGGAGSYEVEFDGSNYPSGVYLYRLMIDGNVIDTKRMILIK